MSFLKKLLKKEEDKRQNKSPSPSPQHDKKQAKQQQHSNPKKQERQQPEQPKPAPKPRSKPQPIPQPKQHGECEANSIGCGEPEVNANERKPGSPSSPRASPRGSPGGEGGKERRRGSSSASPRLKHRSGSEDRERHHREKPPHHHRSHSSHSPRGQGSAGQGSAGQGESARSSPSSPRRRLSNLFSGSVGSVKRARSASVPGKGGSLPSSPSHSPRTSVTTTTVEIKTPTSPHCAQVLPGLLLGSQEIAQDLSWLERHHVTHILNMTAEVDNSYPERFFYKRIAITDMPCTPITDHFDDAYHYIDECRAHGGCVLVHCFYGASRSATIVMAFLMRKERMRYEETLKYLQILRPGTHPNDGFDKQLKLYEVHLNLNR